MWSVEAKVNRQLAMPIYYDSPLHIYDAASTATILVLQVVHIPKPIPTTQGNSHRHHHRRHRRRNSNSHTHASLLLPSPNQIEPTSGARLNLATAAGLARALTAAVEPVRGGIFNGVGLASPAVGGP